MASTNSVRLRGRSATAPMAPRLHCVRSPSALYTEARPILRALAISDAPMPWAFNSRTFVTSIDAGRPL